MNRRKNAVRSLNRLELLELLDQQEKEIDRLKAIVESQNAMLEERRIVLNTSGTLAEAALRLSGIFEAADRAAEIYKTSLGCPADFDPFPED